MGILRILSMALAAMCIIWYIVATIQIMDYVRKKGVKINWFLIRLLLPWYVSRYQKLTREESGRTGAWFYHWIIAINGLLVFAVLAIIAE